MRDAVSIAEVRENARYCSSRKTSRVTASLGKVRVRMTTLRERQAPLKAQYEADPESAKLVMTVRSATAGDDPTRCTIATVGVDRRQRRGMGSRGAPMAGGEGDLACSGDLLLASLAACQEITLRMVAAAMGIELRNVEVNIEGDLDFRGTMGIDPETPVGFQSIRTSVRFDADAAPDRCSGWPRGPSATALSAPPSGRAPPCRPTSRRGMRAETASDE